MEILAPSIPDTIIALQKKVEVYLDKNPVLGDNTYRLKINYDDDVEYSEEIHAIYYGKKNVFTLTPNPALKNSKVIVNVSGVNLHSELSLRIFNTAGTIILEKKLYPSFKNFFKTPNISGSYFIELLENGKRFSMKSLIVL